MKPLLFVIRRPSRFTSIDRDLIAAHVPVREWRARVDPRGVLATVRAVSRSGGVVCWFAGWHTLVPLTAAWVLRRPSLLITGGVDLAAEPDIGYGMQRGGPRQWAARWCLRRARALLTNSHYSQGELERNAGVPAARALVVHHGLPDPYGELPGTEPRERLVITIGIVDRRNLQRKGLRPFVQAAAHLPDARFVVVGPWDDDAVDELRAIAGPNVELTGWIEDAELDGLLRRASVCVQASRHEGFGMSVAEGMLAGCLPVVTRAGALPEVVGPEGFVAEDPRPETLAAAIGAALDAAGGRARARARERILREFPVAMRERGLLEALRRAGVKDAARG